jgi:hypothetical protein
MNPRLPDADSNGDEPVDAHLRAALRHAPDADAAPSAALSAAILSQARAAALHRPASSQATALSPASPLLTWLRQGWMALSQPALATGLASVMVASVVGVMWWDRTPEEMNAPQQVSHDTALPSVVADETKSAAKPTPSGALQNPVRPDPSTGLRTGPVEGLYPSTPELRHSPLVQSLPKVQSEQSEVVQRSPGPAAANTTAPNQPTSNAERERRAVANAAPNDKEVALNAPTHRAEAPPATAPAALPESTDPRGRADAPAPAPAVAAAPAPALKASLLERESARTSGIALGFAASTPVTSLREAMRDEPERWAWQKNAGAVAPVVPALPGWLAQLESATAGRWAPQLDLRASSAAQKTLLTLRWIRDGQTEHTLVLQADGLLWQKAGAAEPAWFAPLNEGMINRLMNALP